MATGTEQQPDGLVHQLRERLGKIEWTFFRVHLSAFVFVPLIASGIFYASNGKYRVSYLDSLFLCYSSMTVTGLSVVNLSTLTAWQQVMLYLLMLMGDITTVSWIMVLVRKRYFRRHIENLPETRKIFPRTREDMLGIISSPVAIFRPRDVIPVSGKYASPDIDIQIKRPTPHATFANEGAVYTGESDNEDENILSDIHTFTSSPRAASVALSPINTRTSHRGVEFDLSNTINTQNSLRQRRNTRMPTRSATILVPEAKVPENGLPNPLNLVGKVFKRAAPRTYRQLQRKMTMPSVTTLEATRSKWLRGFNLDVGRNSHFYTETLTDEQLEYLGGAEYRALRVLSYLVPAYFVGSQLITFIIFAPWLSTTSTYDDVFSAQPRDVNKTWFSLFQIMAAYTGGGLSLVDAGMVPFQTAYLMIFPLIFAILAGNHALPIFLRLVIWIGSKLSKKDGDLDQAFDFLLHHPRRCFIYLFPSHQTWFLVISLLVMSAVEWVGFEVLNTGLNVYKALNTGARIVDGLFQGLAARASGFTIVALSETAPALQFLYVVMMYIAVYPVAMSIRSTNVNEEGSLGIFEAAPDDEDEEPTDLEKYEPRERVGKYLSWHVRRQVSIDIWWLVWAVFLVAIIERGQLMDPNEKWFDMFRVLFELVSAFGGIGLSLGFPNGNYSFCGSFKPLSKLVVIVIMVRGRHRGLPVAIDPSINLPMDLARRKKEEEQKAKSESNGLGLENVPENVPNV